MRIPSADDYFGQRIAQVYPSDDIESMRAMTLSKGKSETGGLIASKEVAGIGANIADLGLEQYRHEESLKAIKEKKIQQAKEKAEKELQAKFEQAQKEKEKSELQAKIINYRSALDDKAFEIFSNNDIPDDQKLAEFEKAASEIKTKVSVDFGDKAHVLEPLHAEALYKAKDRLQNMQIKKLNDESRANVISIIDQLEQRAAISHEKRTEAIQMLDAIDFTGFSEQEKQKIKQGFKEKTAQNEILNRLNKKDYEGTLKDLKATDSDGNPIYLNDLDPKDREHFIGSIQNAIEQEKRQKEAETKAAQREWKQNVRDLLSDYKDAKLSGLPVNPKDEVRLYKMVKGTEFEKKFDAIKKQGESLSFITEKLSKDPLTFGAARLGIQVEPLNLTDTAMLPQLQKRMEIGKKVRELANLTYTPVLTADESKGLADLLKKQQTGSVQTIQQFTKILGKDAMMGIAKQVAAEDTQVGMMIAFIAQGKAGIANFIAEGNKYIKEKVIKMPKEDDLRDKFDTWTRDAFLGLPENSNAHYDAFKAYYAARAARKGITDGLVDKDIAKEAFKAVVGDVVKLNGKRIVIPDGYTEDRFKNSIKLINADTIKAMGGVYGMSDEDAASVIKDDAQWFLTSQEGTYRVVVNGKYLLTNDGRYVQFRFGK